MKYHIIEQDVTKMLPEYVTAQCISNDCGMGAGVVVAFMKVFPGLKEHCIDYIKHSTYITNRNSARFYDPYRHTDPNTGTIYNMFTKETVWQHAGYGIGMDGYLRNLRNSLEFVKESMIDHNETKIAMPKIGCGIDGCDWNDVEKIILEIFSDTDIEVCICVYNRKE